MPKIATLSDLRSIREPGPLEELWTIPGTDLQLRIVGITNRFDMSEKIYKQSDILSKMPAIIMNDTSSSKMNEVDLETAAFLAGCVAEPKLPAIEWAKWLYENPSKVIPLRHRCLVACRIIADLDAEALNGIGTAKIELEADPTDDEKLAGGQLNPFASSSSSSASTNSDDSHQSSRDPGDEEASGGIKRSRRPTPRPTSTASSPPTK